MCLTGRGVTVMKIMKNAAYDYAKNNVDEINGYTKWYDGERLKRKRNAFMIRMRLGMFLALFICTKLKGSVLKVVDWRFGAFLAGVFVTSLLLIPLRDLIKLTVISGGKLNESCLLSCYKDPGSVYNGFVDKKKIIISLIMPLVIISALFTLMTVFTQGVLHFFALIMLILSLTMITDDLYMLVYCLKHIDKNDIVFGEYKKIID